MTKVKICGIKTADAAFAALDAGADMLGFNFYRPVRRYVEPALAASIIDQARKRRDGWTAVGVFVDEPADSLNAIAAECGLDMVQLAGEEPPVYLHAVNVPAIKVIRQLDAASAYHHVERFLLDSHVDGFYGGTGVAGQWAALGGKLNDHILAGGLTPDNVRMAVELTQPWGVDVASGVETDGMKDPALIEAFIKAVKA